MYPNLNGTEQITDEIRDIVAEFPEGGEIDTAALLLYLSTNYYTKPMIEEMLNTWANGIIAGTEGVYSQEEIDQMFTAYYTAVQVNNLLNGFVSNTALAAILEDFITENELTTELANYVTSAAIATMLAGYVTTSNLTTTLASYVTSSDLALALADKIEMSDLTSVLASYVTSTDLATTLTDYISSTALNTILATYVTGTELTTALSNYITGTALTTILGDYVTSTALSTSLGSYVTTTALTTILSGYATTTDIADFVTSSDLSTAIANFVTSTELTTILSDYVTAAEAGDFIDATELATALSSYVTSSGLTTILADYVQSTELANYVTTTALTTALSSYVTSTGLTAILSDYVTSGTLTSTLSSYVTLTSLTSILTNYVTSASLSTILNGYVASVNFTTANITESANKRFVTDAQLTVIGNTSGTNSGDETAGRIGTLISGAGDATSIADTDLFGVTNSAASHILRKITWANFKAVIKTWLDTVYTALPSGEGIVAKSATNTTVTRTITGTTNLVDVVNGDGKNGNPTLAVNLGTYVYSSTSIISRTSTSYTAISAASNLTGLPAGKYMVFGTATIGHSSNNTNAFLGLHYGTAGNTVLIPNGEQYMEPDNASKPAITVIGFITLSAGQILELKTLSPSGTLRILCHQLAAIRIG